MFCPEQCTREKGNVAPEPQLGHNMPKDLPFRLGVSKPFTLVQLKKRKKKKILSIPIFLRYKSYLTINWFNTSLQWGNEPLWCMSQAQCALQIIYAGKELNEVWQCHHEVATGFHVSRGILDVIQNAPTLLEFCKLKMRVLLALCVGFKLESLPQGSVDLEKTPVNQSPSSLLGQSWLATSEAPVTQGLNPAALHSLPCTATGNL